MACAGSVLTTFSLLVTSFAPSISTMYFTFGVLWGTGGSFLFFSGLLVLRFYFNRNVSLANGITMTGAGLGTLIFNVMLQELDEKYGWRGGMRVLSVFSALTFLCGCTYIPPPVEYLPFERRSLVRMALSHGIPVSQGALLLGYLSLSAIFGKLLCGRLADLPRVRRLYIFVISATVLSVSSMCVTAARSYHGLLAYALVAGFFDGCFVVTVPLITQDIVGKELMAKAIGIQYGLVAFPLTLGPPVLGELYKSTNSFTTAFFVSSCSVLVGVSLIYLVQRIRPDLTHKEEDGRREVYDPSLSIHSVSVVDTLSGMFVTEPGVSLSNLEPVEMNSYQRFDGFRREDSRANFLEPFQGQMASKTEMENVYRRAVDNLSSTGGGTAHQRNRSDISGISKATLSSQSQPSDMVSGSMLSSLEMPRNLTSSSGLQAPVGETNDSAETSESIAYLVSASMEKPHPEEGGIQRPDEDIIMRKGDDLENLLGASDKHDATVGLTSNIPTVSEAGGIEEAISDVTDVFLSIEPQQMELENTEAILPEALTLDDMSAESDVELVKLPPPPESHIKRRIGLVDALTDDDSDTDNISGVIDDNIEIVFVPNVEGTEGYGEALGSAEECTRTLLVDNSPTELESGEEVFQLVRIPPPPSIPRTGQLVALKTDANEDLRNASISVIKSDTDDPELYLEEATKDVSPKDLLLAQRKEKLHLAIIDQLNELSERLEAVAARQIQQGENGDDDEADQRAVFSPALQSLPLTPLYSASHSVPLTPVRAWSSSRNTPAPTPHQTPPSAFLTTAPTPIHTPRTPAQSLSEVCAPNDVSATTPSYSKIRETSQGRDHGLESWKDVNEMISPTPSRESFSRNRSRCSSSSEVGQELVLNEWSLWNMCESTEAFPSKLSSGTNSSISNSAKSLGDLHNVSEPIDVVGVMTNEGQVGHTNSPVDIIVGQPEPSPICEPKIPQSHLQETDVSRQSQCQQHLHITRLQAIQVWGSSRASATSHPPSLEEENFYQDVIAQEAGQQFEKMGPNLNERDRESTTEIRSEKEHNYCQPESMRIPQPEGFCHPANPAESQELLESVTETGEVQISDVLIDQKTVEQLKNPILGAENLFLETDKHNPFQPSPEGIPVQSQNPFQGLDESLTQQERFLSSCPQTETSIILEQFKAEEPDAISSERKNLSHISTTSDKSPRQVDQLYCKDNLVAPDQGPQQQNIVTSYPENEATETDLGGSTLATSENITDTYRRLTIQSNWTIFNSSEESLIFEMDVESESSSEGSSRFENASTKISSKAESKTQDPSTNDQENLFPPLQIFSDAVDIITSADDHGIPLKLLPPPKQFYRKRTDSTIMTNEEDTNPLGINVKEHERVETFTADVRTTDQVDSAQPKAKIDNRHKRDMKLKDCVENELQGMEANPVLSGADLSATGNSVSEIESDLLTESKLDDLTSKQSDNSISGIICQDFELIQDEEEECKCENDYDSNADEDLTKTSVPDDIAPLLVKNDEHIQYVNLRDLPQDSQVLQKHPTTTSSTDDSSTSTDSSSNLSETELPYNKLHEDSYTSDQG
ncbi:Monocarboxylate transporter 10 [Stylophora pistillata]|uniref:Monocarboxylate transporter 10 n=1 Tax=Stylophora pistillata TaxID=50429 RepID=A0A2B4RV17_STYPI|nr:Monocarboxylate transporter 10 [Stylophora pistillata]